MDPNQASFGSGSPLLGGTGALEEAMSRRGMTGGGALDQQSPASAGFDPSMAASPPPTAQAPGIPSTPSPLMGGPTGGAEANTPEAQLIIKALSQRLGSLSKQNEAQTIPQAPMGV